jgi:acetamidase/formamidase
MPSPTATSLFNTTNSTTETQTPAIVTATAESACFAPVPRVAIGDKVLVMVEDWDKLKLRSEAKVSAENVILELDQYSQLKILDGPVCVYSAETGYSYWFWKVVVTASGETGWVAEGDYTHYFLEEY